MKTFILRGVPASLRRDGWWLDSITRIEASDTGSARRPALHALMLAGLIALSQMPFTAAPRPDPATQACAGCDRLDDSDFPDAGALRSVGTEPSRTVPL